MENEAEQPKSAMTPRMLSALGRIATRRPLMADVVSYGLLCGAAEVTQQSADMKWSRGGEEEVRDLVLIKGDMERNFDFRSLASL